jgi:AraC-like DNA-binding protein
VAETDLSIDRIAGMIGYSGAPHFNAAFKRRFGSAPGAFRKTRRGL